MYMNFGTPGRNRMSLKYLPTPCSRMPIDVEHVADHREDQRERELRHRRDLRERDDRHQVVRQDEEEQRGEERREREARGADDVTRDAVAHQRVAALAEKLELARHDLRTADRGHQERDHRDRGDPQNQRDAGDLEVDTEEREGDEGLGVERLEAGGFEARTGGEHAAERVSDRHGAGGHRCPFCVCPCPRGRLLRPPGVLPVRRSGGGSTVPYLATTR
jgi:hypothetical protein